jgi:hypothetical protein
MLHETSRAEIGHLRSATRKPQSEVAISALKPDAVSNWLAIQKSKHVKPVSLYPCIAPPKPITIQELHSDDHIVLARLSSLHYLHKMQLLTTYLREKKFVNLVSYVLAFFQFQ